MVCVMTSHLNWILRLGVSDTHVPLFDHTVEELPLPHSQFTFHREGLSDRRSECLDTLVSHLDQFAHGSRQLFLKVDIEGAEYHPLAVVQNRVLGRFGEITTELHDVTPSNHAVNPLLNRLARQFSVIHVHCNNSGGVTEIEGVSVPLVLEITFLRNTAGVVFPRSDKPLPGALDQPNDPALPDLSLAFLTGALNLDRLNQ